MFGQGRQSGGEAIEDRAHQYLVRGRVHVLHVGTEGIVATCHAAEQVCHVHFAGDRGWSCSCGRATCAHVYAGMLGTGYGAPPARRPGGRARASAPRVVSTSH